MKFCGSICALFCLVGSTVFVEEAIQPIQDGIVEEFIFPEKKIRSKAKVNRSQEQSESVADDGSNDEGAAAQFVSVEKEVNPSDCILEEELEEEFSSDFCFDHDPYCDPEKKWYFILKPGYYYFSDKSMRKFFDDGGFTIRGEAGCKFWGPLIVWVDGGYFQKSGKALRSSDDFGGSDDIDLRLATITLGLKYIYSYCSCVSFYLGAGPRLFMMMMENDSPHVRGVDNSIGVGGGFDAGLWLFPVPQWPNLFFDLFADYSWKKLDTEADEISSFDYDTDVSGITMGLGIGVRF